MASYLAERRPRLLLSTHAPYLAPAARAGTMHALIAALACYRNCVDENRRPVLREALLEPAATEHFRTLFFTD
jgi:hypothetical protein